jgi:hypothetical protein
MKPKLVTKMKPNINLVEVHPQLSSNRHLTDGVLVGANSLRPFFCKRVHQIFHVKKNLIVSTKIFI